MNYTNKIIDTLREKVYSELSYREIQIIREMSFLTECNIDDICYVELERVIRSKRALQLIDEINYFKEQIA